MQAFTTADGSALALFSYNMAYKYAAAPGKTLKPLRGSEGLLEPGNYASIQRNVVNIVAAVIPPAASDGLVQVIGSTGGTVSFETA